MFTLESWPADASVCWVADVVFVLALASFVAILSPIALGAQLLTPEKSQGSLSKLLQLLSAINSLPDSSVSRLAFAPSVDGVAGGLVVTVALVGAVGPKSSLRTGFAAVGAPPSAWTATVAVHVVTLAAILARATTQAPGGEENRSQQRL